MSLAQSCCIRRDASASEPLTVESNYYTDGMGSYKSRTSCSQQHLNPILRHHPVPLQLTLYPVVA